MAGDWIAMRHDLWECPQVVRILSAMCPQDVRKMSERCRIIGALYRTWQLVDRYATDGILHGYTAESLNEAVGIEGWAENLQHVGWLVIEPQHLAVPEFESWFSKSAKRRLADAKRKRGVRQVVSAKCPQNVRNDADKMRTREEKRREEKSIKKPPISPYAESFDRWWKAYPPEGRVAKRKAAGAWRRHVADKLIPVVMAATAEYAACGKVRAGYVRQATTWLNGRAWEDDRAAWESCAAADSGNGAKQTRESVEEIVRRASNAAR